MRFDVTTKEMTTSGADNFGSLIIIPNTVTGGGKL